MACIYTVVRCQHPSCGNEIVLPYSIPLRTRNNPDVSAKGDLYLDVACPQCAHAFRYTPDSFQARFYDTADPYQLHDHYLWFGLWLKCDGESCASHLLIESTTGRGATGEYVKAFASRLTIDKNVMCFSGHTAKFPLRPLWNSLEANDESARYLGPSF
jgi:hypothetical protein